MELKLDYEIDGFKSVDFQYEEHTGVTSIFLEFIGTSILDLAIFNTSRFFGVKSYSGICFNYDKQFTHTRGADNSITQISVPLNNTHNAKIINNVPVNNIDDIHIFNGKRASRSKIVDSEINETIPTDKRLVNVDGTQTLFLKKKFSYGDASIIDTIVLGDKYYESAINEYTSITRTITRTIDSSEITAVQRVPHTTHCNDEISLQLSTIKNYNKFSEFMVSKSHYSQDTSLVKLLTADYIKNMSYDSRSMQEVFRDTRLNPVDKNSVLGISKTKSSYDTNYAGNTALSRSNSDLGISHHYQLSTKYKVTEKIRAFHLSCSSAEHRYTDVSEILSLNTTLKTLSKAQVNNILSKSTNYLYSYENIILSPNSRFKELSWTNSIVSSIGEKESMYNYVPDAISLRNKDSSYLGEVSASAHNKGMADDYTTKALSSNYKSALYNDDNYSIDLDDKSIASYIEICVSKAYTMNYLKVNDPLKAFSSDIKQLHSLDYVYTYKDMYKGYKNGDIGNDIIGVKIKEPDLHIIDTNANVSILEQDLKRDSSYLSFNTNVKDTIKQHISYPFLSKDYYHLKTYNLLLGTTSDYRDMAVYLQYALQGEREAYDAFEMGGYLANTYEKNLYADSSKTLLDKSYSALNGYNYSEALSKDYNELYYDREYISVSMSYSDLHTTDNGLFAIKEYNSTFYNSYISSLTKGIGDSSYSADNLTISKGIYYTGNSDNLTHLFRNADDTYVANGDTTFFKDKGALFHDDDNISMVRGFFDGSNNGNRIFAAKDYGHISPHNNVIYLSRDYCDAGSIGHVTLTFGANDVFYDYTDLAATKHVMDINSSYDNLTASKSQENINYNYKNIFATKQDNTTGVCDTSTVLSKGNGGIQEKDSKISLMKDYADIQEKEHTVALHSTFGDTVISNAAFISRTSYGLQEDHNVLFIFKNRCGLDTVNNDLFILKDIISANNGHDFTGISRSGVDVAPTNNLSLSKTTRYIQTGEQIIDISRYIHDVNSKSNTLFISSHGRGIQSIEQLITTSTLSKDTVTNGYAVNVDIMYKPVYEESTLITALKGKIDLSASDTHIDILRAPVNIRFDNEDNVLSKLENVLGIGNAFIDMSRDPINIGYDHYIVALSNSVKHVSYDKYEKMLDASIINIFYNSSYTAVDAIIDDVFYRDDSVGLTKGLTFNQHSGTVNVSTIIKPIETHSGTVRASSIVKDLESIKDRSVSISSVVQGIGTQVKDQWYEVYNDMRVYSDDIAVSRDTSSAYLTSMISTVNIGYAIKLYNTQKRFNITKMAGYEAGNVIMDGEFKSILRDDNIDKHLLSKDKINAAFPMLDTVMKDKVMKDIVYGEGEWLWDNTPHMDLTSGGVDELLLPQTDFDYSAFKTDLLDPVTHKPINPVKVLPDGSFIAARPVDHPLPEYNSIAKDYLAVDVQLLRLIIETYYNIWQQNIFKFGALDMRATVAKMLEYIDAYVDYNIPTPLIPQAKRVVRLIRWYGEASILKHSHYKIRYIYEELKSDLFTGECKIPNTMDNMHIDNRKYTITNTIVNTDCYIEFEIDNPIDTKISFLGYIDNEGQLDVYINDTLEAIYTISTFKAELDVVASGAQKNKVKLFFHGTNNGIINISNVIVADMVYSDIITEYSPSIGSGNKVLDDLVKRVAIYGELYENNAEFIEQTTNSNLAVTDLIDRLNNYFSQHHEKKHKGKRKVTKQ